MASLETVVFWKDKNTSSHTQLYESFDVLADFLFNLSKDNPYTQSKEKYLEFCKELFDQQTYSQNNIYKALVLLHEVETKQCVGFLTAHIVFESVEIDFIIVHQKYRQQGYAQKLFYVFEEKIAEEKKISHLDYKIFLEVSENNHSAICFYKKMGFKQLDVRQNYYKNNENALIMIKERF